MTAAKATCDLPWTTASERLDSPRMSEGVSDRVTQFINGIWIDELAVRA